jgi:hypothetical protein
MGVDDKTPKKIDHEYVLGIGWVRKDKLKRFLIRDKLYLSRFKQEKKNLGKRTQ